VAPFAGLITARNIDIGDLISSDSQGSAKELFHIADISALRIYVSVPEIDGDIARDGSEVDVTLDEFPAQFFKGKIARNSQSIDQTTRTLRVEIDVDNPKGEIKTGAYVLTHFKQTGIAVKRALVLPANAVLFRSEGIQAAVVKGNKAELIGITIGRDFGSSLEVVSGLNEGDKVIVNPSDSLISGTDVRVAETNGTK
jgi:RND family efflux transporter MFP subunit